MEMRDPDAVQFSRLERCNNDRLIWTGELNSKNGFGAYAGFQTFYYDGTRVAFLDDPAAGEMIRRC